MKVIFSLDSQEDLVEIAAFIAADSPRYARKVAAALKAKAMDLSSMAERFPVVGSRASETVRRRVYGNYSIFYYVDGPRRTVVIARIVHSARDHERLLFPED
jgi:toxin ParE1/3/4